MSTPTFYPDSLTPLADPPLPIVFEHRPPRPYILSYGFKAIMSAPPGLGSSVQQVTHAMGALRYGNNAPDAIMEYLKKELPVIIGQQWDMQLATQLAQMVDHVEEITAKQHAVLGTQLEVTKEALLAKKSSSIVTVNGSLLSVGKITEAFSKAVDLVKGMGSAWRGMSNVGTNVDNVSFPRQLGRAALGGARGTMKIGAAGLGAAVVMSALLATSGIALNKVHDAFPSVPSATAIVAGISGQAEKLKVEVGVFEVSKAGAPEAKTLTVQERATALLAQHGNDYGKTIASVNAALGQSYLNDANVEAIAKQKQLLTTLQTMQTQAPGVAVAATTSGPSM